MKLLHGIWRHIVKIFETEIEMRPQEAHSGMCLSQKSGVCSLKKQEWQEKQCSFPASNNVHKCISINLDIKHKNTY